jgi:hypothetical protein
VSLAAHAALFAVWLSTRPAPPPAESPTFQVTLVRPPPRPPRPEVREAPPPPVHPPRALELHPPRTSLPPTPKAPPPVEVSPEWRVKPGAGGADLDAAPFVLGRKGLNRARGLKPSCKSLSFDRPVGCPPDDTELAASKSDPARDARTAGFEGEGRYKRATKAYKEGPLGGPYPGLACSLFHKC